MLADIHHPADFNTKRKKSIGFALITVLFFGFVYACPAQETNLSGDSTFYKKHNPKTATLYSALLPGLGQAYNRKYWKIPLVYGAGGAMVYYLRYNQVRYTQFRDAYNAGNTQSVYHIEGYTVTYNQLLKGREAFRRYRDISIAGILAIYFLNIVDAMVDAYFVEFDVSDDLTLQIKPAIVDNFDLTASLGIKFSVGF